MKRVWKIDDSSVFFIKMFSLVEMCSHLIFHKYQVRMKIRFLDRSKVPKWIGQLSLFDDGNVPLFSPEQLGMDSSKVFSANANV